jgi:hypothetical protein
MYAENEILFPPYVIPKLRASRGEAWRHLVERVSRLPQDDPRHLAFSLMMIYLDGCMRCETDSYRAMRGCTACARQSLRRFKGTDEELLQRYQDALHELQEHLELETVELPVVQPLPAQAA